MFALIRRAAIASLLVERRRTGSVPREAPGRRRRRRRAGASSSWRTCRATGRARPARSTSPRMPAYIRLSSAFDRRRRTGRRGGRATARRTAPSMCSGTDVSIEAAARSAVAAGWPSSHRPIQPLVGGPPPKRPFIQIAIDVKCDRSGFAVADALHDGDLAGVVERLQVRRARGAARRCRRAGAPMRRGSRCSSAVE